MTYTQGKKNDASNMQKKSPRNDYGNAHRRPKSDFEGSRLLKEQEREKARAPPASKYAPRKREDSFSKIYISKTSSSSQSGPSQDRTHYDKQKFENSRRVERSRNFRDHQKDRVIDKKLRHHSELEKLKDVDLLPNSVAIDHSFNKSTDRHENSHTRHREASHKASRLHAKEDLSKEAKKWNRTHARAEETYDKDRRRERPQKRDHGAQRGDRTNKRENDNSSREHQGPRRNNQEFRKTRERRDDAEARREEDSSYDSKNERRSDQRNERGRREVRENREGRESDEERSYESRDNRRRNDRKDVREDREGRESDEERSYERRDSRRRNERKDVREDREGRDGRENRGNREDRAERREKRESINYREGRGYGSKRNEFAGLSAREKEIEFGKRREMRQGAGERNRRQKREENDEGKKSEFKEKIGQRKVVTKGDNKNGKDN